MVEPQYSYTYCITNLITNKKYIGVRSCNTKPEDDLGKIYFSSSSNREFMRDQKYNYKNYLYQVLNIFYTRKEAELNEIELHELYDVRNNEEYLNEYNASFVGFNSLGKVAVIDPLTGITSQVDINDSRYLSGELVSIFKDHVTVTYKDENNDIYFNVPCEEYNANKDKYKTVRNDKVAVKSVIDGRNLLVDKDDKRYLSGELVAVTYGMGVYKNDKGEIFHLSCDDPRIKKENLVGNVKGQMTVRYANDADKKYFNVSVDDPRLLTGEIIQNTKGTMPVMNVNTGEKTRLAKDDPRIASGEYISTSKGRTNFYDLNGKLYFRHPSDTIIKELNLIGKNHELYKEMVKLNKLLK